MQWSRWSASASSSYSCNSEGVLCIYFLTGMLFERNLVDALVGSVEELQALLLLSTLSTDPDDPFATFFDLDRHSLVGRPYEDFDSGVGVIDA